MSAERPEPKKGRGGARAGAGGARAGAGHPPFEPSEDHRKMVRLMVGFGIPHERIRLGITNPRTGDPISVETLVRAFKRELEIGTLEMDSIALTSLAMKVREGNMTAIIWYTKNRMGWRDHFQVDSETGLTGPMIPPKLTLVFSDKKDAATEAQLADEGVQQ